MTLTEQFDLESNYEYMRSMRDAWQREAEALRSAMIKWARRANDAEALAEHLAQDLQELRGAVDIIQTHAHTHIRRPAQGGEPMSKNRRRILTPIEECAHVPLPVREPATLTPIRTLTPKAQEAPTELNEGVDAPFLQEMREPAPRATVEILKEMREIPEEVFKPIQEVYEMVDSDNRHGSAESRRCGCYWCLKGYSCDE